MISSWSCSLQKFKSRADLDDVPFGFQLFSLVSHYLSFTVVLPFLVELDDSFAVNWNVTFQIPNRFVKEWRQLRIIEANCCVPDIVGKLTGISFWLNETSFYMHICFSNVDCSLAVDRSVVQWIVVRLLAFPCGSVRDVLVPRRVPIKVKGVVSTVQRGS